MEEKMTELTGPIVMKDAAKKVAYAAVLVPGEKDSDGESVTAEKIEEAAHEWMRSYRNVDLQHSLNNVAVPVESYVLPVDLEVDMAGVKSILPQGSWVLASKVFDESTWKQIENGTLTGYSVMGIKRTTLEAANKEQADQEEAVLKKTLLRDLGDDWVAAAVSIVDQPAVPKAKFFAIKSAESQEGQENEGEGQEYKPWYQKAIDVLSHAGQKEGRRISDRNYKKLRQAFGMIKELLDEAEAERGGGKEEEEEKQEEKSDDKKSEKEAGEMEEQMKEALKEVMDERLKPLEEEIEALKSRLEDEGSDDESSDEEGEGKAEKSEEEGAEGEDKQEEVERLREDFESFKQQINEKLDEAIKSKPASRSLKGQDGEQEEEKTGQPDRDALGRKIKKRGDR